MKKIMAVIMSLTMLLGLCPSALAEARYEAEFSILGTTVDFENEAFSDGTTVYVPLEELSSYLRINLQREGNTYNVSRRDKSATLSTENMVCTANGKEVLLSAHPIEKNGVVYVPGDFFEVCLGMPVTKTDVHSMELTPNIYTLSLDEMHAAAVSGSDPEKDTLAASTTGTDNLFEPGTRYSAEKLNALYYMIDFSSVIDLDIVKVDIDLYLAKGGNNNPYINMIRTDLWEKGKISYNNRPEEYRNEVTKSVTLGDNFKKNKANYIWTKFDITSLTNTALKTGNILPVKVQANPYSGMVSAPSNTQAAVYGVNTKYAPKIYVTTEESFTFPVKKNNLKMHEALEVDEIQILASLGVVTETDEFPLNINEVRMSRGEFVKFAMRLRNENQISVGEEHFSDVPADNEYFTAISSAYAAGYITGEKGTAFRPYDAVTLNEACAIIGRMLGYDEYAKQNGGYAQGYLQAATKNSLLSGVQSVNGALTYKGAVKMFVNSLDAPMFVATVFSPGVIAEYNFDESTTILSEYFDAKELKGTVTANEFSALEGSVASSEHIVIDGKKLTIRYKGYNDFLGYSVKAYYNSDDVLLYMGSKEGNPDVIDLCDMENVTEDSSAVTVYYKENDKSKNISFSKSRVIYNGKALSSGSVKAQLFDCDGGQLIKLKNGSVIVNAYSTMIAYSINLDDEIISDKYEPYEKTLRLKNADSYSVTDTEGNEISLGKVKAGSVLSVAKSIDSKIIKIIVSEKQISGTVQTVTDGGSADEILEISGLSYKTANRYDKWTKEVFPGKSGTFFIDAFGNICDYEDGATEDVLGYLIALDYAPGSTLSKKLQAAIMVKTDKEYRLFDFADKVEINGDKETDHAVIYQAFLDEEDAFVQQAVIFSTDSKGKINKINQAVDATGTLSAEQKAAISDKTLVKRHSSPSGTKNIYYKSSSGRLSDQFYWKIASKLTVVIPENTAVIDDFETITSGVTNGNIEAEVYTVGLDSPVAEIVLLRNYMTSTSPTSALYVVQKISKQLDEEGYYVTTLHYATTPGTVEVEEEGEYTYYTASPGKFEKVIVPDEDIDLISGVDRGDIIRIAKNYNGELIALSKCYDYSDKTITATGGYATGSINAQYRIYGGYAISKDGDYVKIAQDAENVESKPQSDFRWIDVESSGVLYKYIVDGNNVVITQASADDIVDYNTVPYAPSGLLLYTRYTVLNSAYIVELAQPAGTGVYKAEFTGGDDYVGTPPAFIRVNIGDTITIPDSGSMMRNEYRFIGWRIGDTVYQPGDSYTITSDTTVFTAEWEWEGRQYLITFSGGDGASGEEFNKTTSDAYPAIQMPTADDNGTPRFTKNGFVYRIWTDGVNDYMPGEIYNITADTTITPKWIECWDGTVAATAPETTVIDGKTFYRIKNGAELAWFSNEVDKSGGDGNVNAILENDIRLNLDGDYVNNWKSYRIGDVNSFKGIFDGNGKKILNLYYSGNTNYEGFVSTLSGGTIKNVEFKDAKYVSNYAQNSSGYASIVCGYAVTGTISGVTVSGSVETASGKYLNAFGSVLGYCNNESGYVNVSNCTSSVAISISADDASAQIVNNNTGIGGIVGSAYRGLRITDSTNTGTVYAPNSNRVGGIVGSIRTNTRNSASGCTNTATVTGYSTVGQIYGYKQADVSVTGSTESGTVVTTAP